MFSQNSEEAIIVDYFKDKPIGRFIDIGAYDVFRFSNTRKLYDLGWSGVLVEPSPDNYKGIAKHYEGDERITVLNIAIGEFNGELGFYESNGDAVSTSDKIHMKKWADAGVKYKQIKVKQMRTSDFMRKYCIFVDFLSIDTEATNMIVFRDIPDFVWKEIQMLCIEHDEKIDEIEVKLLPYGFKTLYINAENIILSKV
jgi:FkbM family methyltransferase